MKRLLTFFDKGSALLLVLLLGSVVAQAQTTFSASGGVLTISLNVASHMVTATNSAGSYIFTITGTGSLGWSGSLSGATISGTNNRVLTVNSTALASIQSIRFINTYNSLTPSNQVSIGSSGQSNTFSHQFNLQFTNQPVRVFFDGSVTFTGNAGFNIESPGSILFISNSNVQLSGGNALISANMQAVPDTNTPAQGDPGIQFITNSVLSLSANGKVVFNTRGRSHSINARAAGVGIEMQSGSQILTQSGNIEINGYSGALTSTTNNAGTGILLNGSTLRSQSGHVLLLGKITGNRLSGTGFDIRAATVIQTNGAGRISIEGSGVDGPSTQAGTGLNISGSAGSVVRIEALGTGSLSLIGRGPEWNTNRTSSTSRGINISTSGTVIDTTIRIRTNSGRLTIVGNSGIGAGTSPNFGVYIFGAAGTHIETTSGDSISIRGYNAINGSGSSGLSIAFSNSTTPNSITGGVGTHIFLHGSVADTLTNSSTGTNISGNYKISTLGSGNLHYVGFGGGRGSFNNSFGLDIRGVSSPDTSEHSTESGNIILEGTASPFNTGNSRGISFQTVNLKTTGGNISVNGIGGGLIGAEGVTATSVSGVFINVTSFRTEGSGKITVNGVGGFPKATSGSNQYGIDLASSVFISTHNGDLSLSGTSIASNDTTSSTLTNAIGISASGGPRFVVTGTGNLTITGNGGNRGSFAAGTTHHGITINGSSNPSFTQFSTQSGSINITGVSGGNLNGTSNNTTGTNLLNSTFIESAGGAINIQGTSQGGVPDPSLVNSNHGVSLATTSNPIAISINSNGGSITINGNAGNSSATDRANYGVNFGSRIRINSSGGNISLTGNGGSGQSSMAMGVFMPDSSCTVNAGSGRIQLNATGGSNSIDLRIYNSSLIANQPGGSIALISNHLDLSNLFNLPLIRTSSTDSVFILPRTPGQVIRFNSSGSDSANQAMRISNSEVAAISTGTLVVGTSLSGDIINEQNTIFNSRMVLRNAQTSGLLPFVSYTDFTVPNLRLDSLSSGIKFNIDGTSPNLGFYPLKSSGTVNLNGARFLLSGSYVYSGDVLTLVEADSVVGQFDGLPDSSTMIFNGQTVQLLYYPNRIDLRHLTFTPTVTPIILSGNDTICPGTSVTFGVQSTGGGSSPQYTWYLNGVQQGAPAPTFTSNTLLPGDVVSVEMLSSSSGAIPPLVSGTTTITIRHFSAPILTMTTLTDMGISADPITITALPAGGQLTGQGIVGNEFRPWSLDTGMVNVTYTYTNSLGCTAVRSQDFRLLPDVIIWDGTQWKYGTPSSSEGNRDLMVLSGTSPMIPDGAACRDLVLRGGSLTHNQDNKLTINRNMRLRGGNIIGGGTLRFTNAAAQISNTALPVEFRADIEVATGANVTNTPNFRLAPGSNVLAGNNTPNGGGTTSGTWTMVQKGTTQLALYNAWSSPILNGTGMMMNGTNNHQFNAVTQAWETWNPTQVMTPGRGYIATAATNGWFRGALHNGNFNFPVTFNNGGSSWNLIGNPYPSQLNLTDFLNANANVNGTAYFMKNSVNVNNVVLNYTAINGLTVTTDVPVSQGFFVEANANGNATFTNSMRRAGRVPFYTRTQNNAELVWLKGQNLNAPEHQSNPLIGFKADATNGFDRMYDGRLLKGNTNIQFYSMLNNEAMTIQGLPTLTSTTIVPMGVEVTQAGSFELKLDSTTLDATVNIYLEDLQTGLRHNLRNGSFAFNTTQAQTWTSRFRLVFQPLTTSTPTIASNQPIKLFAFDQTLVIDNLQGRAVKEVRLTDLSGRVIENWQQPQGESRIELPTTAANGVYLMTVITKDGTVQTERVLVKY